jgi:hypothetical protein
MQLMLPHTASCPATHTEGDIQRVGTPQHGRSQAQEQQETGEARCQRGHHPGHCQRRHARHVGEAAGGCMPGDSGGAAPHQAVPHDATH